MSSGNGVDRRKKVSNDLTVNKNNQSLESRITLSSRHAIWNSLAENGARAIKETEKKYRAGNTPI